MPIDSFLPRLFYFAAKQVLATFHWFELSHVINSPLRCFITGGTSYSAKTFPNLAFIARVAPNRLYDVFFIKSNCLEVESGSGKVLLDGNSFTELASIS